MTINNRQIHIIESATEVFVRFGFRKTSMQDIADAAGMSRAALYLHFRNKEDVFRSGLQRLYGQALNAARQAMSAEASFATRLESGLVAYAEIILSPAQLSPHGAELFAAHDSLAGELVEYAAAEFQILFVTALTEASMRGEVGLDRVGRSALVIAQTLYYALDGVKTGPGDTASIKDRIRTLASVFSLALTPD